MSTGKSPRLVGDGKTLALIAGPTASGKSDLAVRLALALADRGQRAVVVNADSAQVYADLKVLSARPDEAEMAGIEHRLFGSWDGADPCSAADWAAAAKREIAELQDEGVLPILTGGTGLYIRTLLDGIAPIPPIDPEIRRAARALPPPNAYAALEQEDSVAAAALSPSDKTRVARALEVVRSTGRPLSYWQERREGGIAGDVALHPVILLPDREELYARCDQRFAAMVGNGAVEEVRTLLARGLDPDLPVMRAIGVSQIAGYLNGDWGLEEALRQGAQATRNYAKRQYTWLRHQFPPDWPRLTSHDDNMTSYFATLLLD